MRRALALALALALPLGALAQPAPSRVEVDGPRVSLGELARGLGPDLASLDLGAAPPPGGSRLILREELLQALEARGLTPPRRLPSAVRITRRMMELSPLELERLVRESLPPERLPRGATLSAVRLAGSVRVPRGWTTVTTVLPRPPRRAGPFRTGALVRFEHDGEALAQTTVPVELALSPAAAIPDLARGAPVRLVISRGFVEVTTTGVASADADVGDPVPVLVRPSGRLIQARLVERDRAVATELP